MAIGLVMGTVKHPTAYLVRNDVPDIVRGGHDVLAERHSGHLSRVEVHEGGPATVPGIDRSVDLDSEQPSRLAVSHL